MSKIYSDQSIGYLSPKEKKEDLKKLKKSTSTH